MAKILNLDKLATSSSRVLTLNGVDYKVVPMSVANFIETSHDVEALVKADAPLADQVRATMDMICRCVPDMPRAELDKYGVDKLNMISTFVRGEDVEEQETVAGEEGK